MVLTCHNSCVMLTRLKRTLSLPWLHPHHSINFFQSKCSGILQRRETKDLYFLSVWSRTDCFLATYTVSFIIHSLWTPKNSYCEKVLLKPGKVFRPHCRWCINALWVQVWEIHLHSLMLHVQTQTHYVTILWLACLYVCLFERGQRSSSCISR